MIVKSEFKPAWWLASGHLQTLYPTLRRKIKPPPITLERLELPDGDFVDLAWSTASLPSDSPLVILLHGLGGSMRSTYAAGFMHACNRQGFRTVLMHFRGAGDEPNRLPRAYHSGDTADLNYLIKQLAEREPATKKAVIGVSLGGNVLLKWLGEQGERSLVDAAVAVSVPFQLNLAADRMSSGFSRLYQGYLLRRLKKFFERKKESYTGELPAFLQDVNQWQCLWTFDDNVTAPLHGFANVHAYYRESSSRPYLAKITTPTLIIHALDDPFMSPETIPRNDELSPAVRLELSAGGGHVGFIAGTRPGRPIFWLDERIPDFLKEQFAKLGTLG